MRTSSSGSVPSSSGILPGDQNCCVKIRGHDVKIAPGRRRFSFAQIVLDTRSKPVNQDAGGTFATHVHVYHLYRHATTQNFGHHGLVACLLRKNRDRPNPRHESPPYLPTENSPQFLTLHLRSRGTHPVKLITNVRQQTRGRMSPPSLCRPTPKQALQLSSVSLLSPVSRLPEIFNSRNLGSSPSSLGILPGQTERVP